MSSPSIAAELLRTRATAVWVLLVAATVVSFWLGNDQAIHSVGATATTILVVAFVKIRFIGLDFMELRHAPRQLRLVFEVYCAAACIVLIGFYFLS